MTMQPRRLCLVASLVVAAMSSGCTDPMTGEPVTLIPMKVASSADDAPTEQNIVRVNKFFHANPWLTFNNDGSDRVDGIRFSVYLEGPHRSGGVFGSGTMVVSMYRLDVDQTGRERPTKVHEWELPSEQAYPWRAKKKSLLGWGYGLRLQWDDKLRLEGRQVAMVIKYVREDGQVISSTRQVLKVPVRHVSTTARG